MVKVKVTAVGNSRGIVLPKEVLSRMNVDKGDVLYLVEGPEGWVLTPYAPDFEQQIAAAKGVMRQYRNALRELAK